jgi:hypothetical protein
LRHKLSERGKTRQLDREVKRKEKEVTSGSEGQLLAATALYPQRLEPASNGFFAQKECLATESMSFPLRIQQQDCI